MSGIAGICSLSGRPVDAGLMQRMTDAVLHRGPDAGGCWSGDGVALGQRTMWTTPESLADSGPLQDAEADLCLAFDGRLDNREDLIRTLGLEARARSGLSDSALLLHGYRAWQEGVAGRILGDFAFAVWDGRRRTLFCARDIMGIRPFHYASRDGLFAFGSELRQLLLVPGVTGALNEAMVGEYLAWAITSHGETLYRDIQCLPPAHSLTIDAQGRIRIRRYWDLDFAARIRYAKNEDYAHHLLELIRASIASRLRARGRIGVTLSGGLDSSTVCTLAKEQSGLRGDAVEGLDAYGVVFPGLPCDESTFIEAAARHAGVPVHLLPSREEGAAEFTERAMRTRNFPGYPMGNDITGAICAGARANACRVMLTGEGSDEMFGGSADRLADLFREGRLAALWREARPTAATLGLSLARVLLRHAVKPWLNRAAIAAGMNGYRRADLSWLSEDWAKAIGLRQRIAAKALLPRGASCAQWVERQSNFSAHSIHFYEMIDLGAFAGGVEYRHPMLDRRLIEFACAVPQDLHWRQGRGKWLLRSTMRDRLGAVTMDPGTNTDFTIVIMRALDRILLERPVARWPVAQAGWVNAQVLDSEYRSARADFDRGRRRSLAAWKLWMAYGVGSVMDAAAAQSLTI